MKTRLDSSISLTRLTSLTAITLLVLAEMSATYAGVVIFSSLGSCGSPGPVKGDGISFFTQDLSTASCRASALSLQGVGSASSLSSVQWNTTEFSSGGLRADASASFSEQQIVADLGPSDEFGAVLFQPKVQITGSVSAPEGSAAGTFARIGYTLGWAGGFVSGSLQQDSGANQQNGTLGIIKLPPKRSLINDVYTINGRVDTVALVNKGFQPGFISTGFASADFSHTLRWMGVEVLQVFDKNLQPVATPPGFRFRLLGQTSGFDYFNAAPPPAVTSGCVKLDGLAMNNRSVVARQPGVTAQTMNTDVDGCYFFAGLIPGKSFNIIISGPRAPVPQDSSGCVKFNGLPMANRTVSANQANVAIQTVKTHVDGCYAFTGLVSGKNFNIVIEGPKIPVPQNTSGCLTLDGLPMKNRTVSAKQLGMATQTVKTGVKGCYAFDVLVPGKSFNIVISGPNVTIPQDTSGCVKFNGLPMNNRTVSAHQSSVAAQTVTTDANGCYAFPELVPGKSFNIFISGPKIPAG